MENAYLLGLFMWSSKREQQDKYFTLVFHSTLDVGGYFVIDWYTKS